MASVLRFLACLFFFQLSSAHRIEILTTSRPDGTISEADCSSPADVIFVLDGSKSMSPEDFQKQLDFVRTFIQDIEVSNDKVRVGITTFSTKVHTAFSLNTYKTKEAVEAAISKITSPHRGTHTWLVLDYLRKDAFTVDNGGRVGVPKIAIILTDGSSQDKEKTLAAATMLHEDPILVYAIGVGQTLDKEELTAIASKMENIYLVPDFRALKAIEDTVSKNICKKVCGVNPVDIIFMLDESTSVRHDDYRKQKDFIVSFIKDAVIGPNNTQIGIFTFSTHVMKRFFLNQHQKRRDLLDAVKAIRPNPNYGDTYTDKALSFITRHGFTAKHGGRQGVPHVVIVITDGKSTRPALTIRAAEEMRKSGVTIFAIGIGSATTRKELDKIAGDESRVYQVASYDDLKGIDSARFSKVCI